jgi:hypothetical protein
MAFQVGSKVKLKSTGEVGVVVHSWFDSELDDIDYYVAFFGATFPTGKPDAKPYVLRYMETSLEPVLVEDAR